MNIEVGDLVMVVRWPHEHKAARLGAVFRVGIIWGSSRCPICSEIIQELSAGDERGCVPFSWLKKIPPLSELEGKLDLADIRGPQPIKERA